MALTTPQALSTTDPNIDDRNLAGVEPAISPVALLLTALGCALLSMLGGVRQARAASSIPPVEALREASGAPARRESWLRSGMRGLGFLLSTAAVVGMFAWVALAHKELGEDLASQVGQMAFIAIPLTGLAITAVLPWVVGPVTRLWTGALPVRSASWHLARHTVLAKRDRLVRSIVPVMFAVGLVFGLMAVGQTFINVAVAVGVGELEGSSATSLLTLMGLPLAIAVAGAVGNLVMMSRQRSAEVALGGVIGATPRQQVLVPAFEALIITLTASILGLVMAVVGTSLMTYTLGLVLPGVELGLPWGLLAASFGLCLVVVTAATVIPVLRSLRQPAPKVIATLVGA